jgi:hypothetical protein
MCQEHTCCSLKVSFFFCAVTIVLDAPESISILIVAGFGLSMFVWILRHCMFYLLPFGEKEWPARVQ